MYLVAELAPAFARVLAYRSWSQVNCVNVPRFIPPFGGRLDDRFPVLVARVNVGDPAVGQGEDSWVRDVLRFLQ